MQIEGDDESKTEQSEHKLKEETREHVCASCNNPISNGGVDNSGFCINCFSEGNSILANDENRKSYRNNLGVFSILLLCISLVLLNNSLFFLLTALGSIISGSFSKSTMGAIAAVLSVMLMAAYFIIVMLFLPC